MSAPGDPIDPGTRSVTVALGLGANIGDRRRQILSAADQLRQHLLQEAVCSTLLETAPDDCPPGAPPYLNAAIVGRCQLPLRQLLQRCLDLEGSLGRPRQRGYHVDRLIDIDILLYGDAIVHQPDLQVPHPGLTQRQYVLQPLVEIAPDLRIPTTGHTIRHHYQHLT